MKVIWSFCGAVLMVVYFSSCQKPIDWQLTNETIEDSSISKLVILDTSYTTGLDTSILMLFSYDANKRITKFSNIYFVAASSTREAIRDYYYYYNGTDTVPYRIIEDYQDIIISGGFKDTSYFFYTNGLLVKDSVRELNGSTVNNYDRLSPTRCRTIKLLVGMPPSMADTSYSYVNWQNGNLIEERDSLYYFQPPQLTEVKTTQIVYDNKPNPFRKLFTTYPAPFFPTNIYTDYISQFYFTPSMNNPISWQFTTGTDIISYEYNTVGLPKVARTGGGVSSYKLKYYYTQL